MKEIEELKHVDDSWQVCITNCDQMGVSVWDPKTRKVAFAYDNKDFLDNLMKKWGM